VRLAFVVPGVAQTKGSFRSPAAGVVTDDNPRTKPWQGRVAAAARTAMGGGGMPPIEGPVILTLRFYLPKPRTRRILDATSKPDLDKLVRAVKDGLTQAKLYGDDAQVVEVIAQKAFAAGPHDPLPNGEPRLEVVVDAGMVTTSSGRSAPR
jgi:Holliday junction resolvase RusA-like endonuclease